MNKVIFYPLDGGIVVIFPTGELPITEVARKDVPVGTPYFVIDSADLPPLEQQQAWEADFSEPDGYGIGLEAWFEEQEVLIS